MEWKRIRSQLYGILQSPGRMVKSIKLYDERGNETIDPKESNRFFVELESLSPKIESYKILVAIRDNGQKSEIEVKTPDIDNKKDFNNLLNLIKHIKGAICKKEGVELNWHKFGKEINTKEEAMHNIKESKDVGKLGGTAKSSFQKIGSATLIVRHSTNINEQTHGARTRKIRALFIENKHGERFSYPFVHLTGARAFARHIHNGGTNFDKVSQKIVNLSEDYLTLRRVIKEMKQFRNTSEDIGILRLCTEAINRRLRSMHGPKGYQHVSRELISENILTDMATIDEIHSRLAESCQCQGNNSDLYTDLGVAARYMSQQPNISSPSEFTWSRPPVLQSSEPNSAMDLHGQIMELANSCSNPYIADQLRNIADQIQDTNKIYESDAALFLNAFKSAVDFNKSINVLGEAEAACPEEVEIDEYLNNYTLENVFSEEELDEISKDLAGSYIKGVAREPSEKSGKTGRITGMQQASQKIHGHAVDGKKVAVPATEEVEIDEYLNNYTLENVFSEDDKTSSIDALVDAGEDRADATKEIMDIHEKNPDSDEDVDEGMWDNIKNSAREFWHGTQHEKDEEEYTKDAFNRWKQNPKSFKDKPVNEPVDEDFWDNVKLPDQPKKPEPKTPQAGEYNKSNPEDMKRLEKDLSTGKVKMMANGKPVQINENIERLKKLSGIK